jgi:hypothetical protein
MLLVLPLFEAEFFIEPYHSWDYGMTAIVAYYGTSVGDRARDCYINYHEDRRHGIIYFSIDLDEDLTWTWEEEDPAELRSSEKHYSVKDDIVAVFDLRADTKLAAALNICKTIFVCIVIAIGTIYFTKDANELIVIPIERMIDRVKRIAKNPLSVGENDPTDILKLEKEAASSSQGFYQQICR